MSETDLSHVEPTELASRCVYCEEPMEPRADRRLAHQQCIDRYEHGPPDDFMRSEDGYARQMAWQAGNCG